MTPQKEWAIQGGEFFGRECYFFAYAWESYFSTYWCMGYFGKNIYNGGMVRGLRKRNAKLQLLILFFAVPFFAKEW